MAKLTLNQYCEKNGLSIKNPLSKKMHRAYLDQAEMDLDDDGKAEVRRGGRRPNAGRKALRGETTVMRIPKAYKEAIQGLISHLDCMDFVVDSAEFEPIFIVLPSGGSVELVFRSKKIN